MKRLIASALAVLLCLSLCVVILDADPGDELPPPNGSYPPPPPDYEGFWPPPETTTSGNDTLCDTCEEDGGLPWGDPNQ